MARLPRLIVPYQPHHIIQRGNDRRLMFRDDDDCRIFLSWLREASKEFKVAIHAYVLMPNHIHLLASPTDKEGPSRMMQWLGRYYVPYFNRKYERVGSLFEGRFKATVIDSEGYFMTCCRYIELNPVRAGMVAHAADFEWSSYAHHVGTHPNPLINDHALYWSLGNTPFQREVAYRDLVEQGITAQEVAMLTDATFKGWALGSADFRKTLEKRLHRRVGPTKRGRPIKRAVEDDIE